MNNEGKQENEAQKRETFEGDRVEDAASEQAEVAPMRDVIIWEKSPATRGGGQTQGESTVRAVPLSTGTPTGKPPVIIIVSSGFGAATRQPAPIRMNGARSDTGLRMAA